MRVPSSINANTFKTYQLVDDYIKNYDSNVLQSHNFDKWDRNIPKNLHELCIDAIAANWIDNPILEEIPVLEDRYMLMYILPTNLPLELTVPKIQDDIYWKRCFIQRWPHHKPILDAFEVDERQIQIVNDKCSKAIRKTSQDSDHISDITAQKNGKKEDGRNESRKSSLNSDKRKASGSRKSSFGFSEMTETKSWKHFYIEKHVKGYLEMLEPEEYDPEKIKDLCDLFGNYLDVLQLDEMQCSKTSANKIPLNAILTGFSNLSELSLCLKQKYVGENFSWNVVNTSVNDIKLLCKGLEKIRLKTLRIRNSDINCQKAILIIKALAKHDIKVLDFIHCKIGDNGFMAIAQFTIEKPVEELILANNRPGAKGIKSIIYALTHENCKISKLTLKLNLFFEENSNLLFHALVKHRCTNLKSLFVSGCGFNKACTSIPKMIARNTSLENLDISNNNLGEEIGEEILKALETNYTLKKFDVRMCRIKSETEQKIQELIHKNRDGKHRKPKQSEDKTLNLVYEEMIIWEEDFIQEMETILIKE